MDILSGVRRVWSGAQSLPQRRSPLATAPRLHAAGGRVGRAVPLSSAASAGDMADAEADAGDGTA